VASRQDARDTVEFPLVKTDGTYSSGISSVPQMEAITSLGVAPLGRPKTETEATVWAPEFIAESNPKE
jgi:hypothetical protein